MSSRRITVLTSEPLGRAGTGGAGTADSLLAVALGRHGHDVELLVASGRDIGALSPEWSSRYEAAGVTLRILERKQGVRPAALAPTLEVLEALRERAPDVAVVNDWRGLGYVSQRSRQLGRGFDKTAFVVHCHGPGRVLAEFAQKVPDTAERFLLEATERASVELADALVSPTEWLLDWFQAHDWRLPAARSVVQYIRESAALGEPPVPAPTGAPLRRLAFFGQLREGKGIRIFLDALDRLDPVEVVFLGSDSRRWTRDAILQRVPSARVEAHLTREQALEELRRPGTLAVMPSLLDNAPNTVSECIEHGIPFIAAGTGGIPELVDATDRGRVLFDPNAPALAEALTRALASAPSFAPARPARDPAASLAAWLELVESIEPARTATGRTPSQVSLVCSEASAVGAHRVAQRTQTVDVEVVPAPTRREGLEKSAADWIVFLDDDDDPDDELVDVLVAAHVASGADVVTVGVRPADDVRAVQLFLGDPGALGLVANHYGVLGMVRSDLVASQPLTEDAFDPDWLLFARLATAGARVVSVPEPLSTHTGRPGQIDDVPGDAVAVLRVFEDERGARLRDLPQLAATLAAANARLGRDLQPAQDAARDGMGRLARRVKARLARGAASARSPDRR